MNNQVEITSSDGRVLRAPLMGANIATQGNTLAELIEEIYTKVQNAETAVEVAAAIVQGKSQTFVLSNSVIVGGLGMNVSDFNVDEITIPKDLFASLETVGDKIHNVNDIHLGDFFLITDKGLPDFWVGNVNATTIVNGVAVPAFTLYAVEIDIDLTPYFTREEAQEIIPSIGEDGYWYIGNTNTGVQAAQKEGFFSVAFNTETEQCLMIMPNKCIVTEIGAINVANLSVNGTTLLFTGNSETPHTIQVHLPFNAGDILNWKAGFIGAGNAAITVKFVVIAE